jgi:DNA-binding transcriptional LysR family regulator
MYLGYLSTYQSLVKTRNFHQTAEELGVSQSTVSLHIRRLEDYLGTQLIIRRHSGCELTPQADRFNAYADGILHLLQRARENLDSDTVRVGASTNIGTYLLQPVLKTYLDAHAGEVDVRLTIDRNDQIVEQLVNHQIDLAFTEWWAPRKEFRSEVWRTEPLVVILPANHPLTASKELDPESLVGQPLLGGEKGTGTGRLLRDQLGDLAGKYMVHMNLGNTSAVIEGVRNGLGISIVQESAVTEKSVRAGITVRTLKNCPLVKSIHISHDERLRPDHPAVRLRDRILKSDANP